MKKKQFDPCGISLPNGNYFALPYSVEESDIIFLSLPFDATVSYRNGTSKGPKAIIEASSQVDLFNENVPNSWEVKMGTVPINDKISLLNNKTRKVAEKVINALENGADIDDLADKTDEVNAASKVVNDYVEKTASEYLLKDKVVAVVGGDHSTPFGLMKALSGIYDGFGVLQFDAHADLREAYEGFTYSHASIMYNVLNEIPQVEKIVQVGIRDYCKDESELMTSSPRVQSFTDFTIHRSIFNGEDWNSVCDRIIEALPSFVYISFDIDGLSPEYCPSTGTPVPGGLTFAQAEWLLYRLSISGKKIIGFDLCEVAPSSDGEWDANVGARMLHKIALYTHLNREK